MLQLQFKSQSSSFLLCIDQLTLEHIHFFASYVIPLCSAILIHIIM